MAAGTAAQDNYRVARSYLAETVREDWNPNATVLIRQGEPQTTIVSNTVARYVVPVIASVDELGRYSGSATLSTQTLDFRLALEEGEWRISGLSDGIVLTEAAFAEAFASYRLYFFSAGYRELVPDVRWFATRGEVSSKIVRGLLDAPSFWLDQGATISAFPEGTQLALTPIAVVDGVASVDLTTRVLSADEITRSRMLAQLTASLAQVQGISSARISVNQTTSSSNPSATRVPPWRVGVTPVLWCCGIDALGLSKAPPFRKSKVFPRLLRPSFPGKSSIPQSLPKHSPQERMGCGALNPTRNL